MKSHSFVCSTFVFFCLSRRYNSYNFLTAFVFSFSINNEQYA